MDSNCYPYQASWYRWANSNEIFGKSRTGERFAVGRRGNTARRGRHETELGDFQDYLAQVQNASGGETGRGPSSPAARGSGVQGFGGSGVVVWFVGCEFDSWWQLPASPKTLHEVTSADPRSILMIHLDAFIECRATCPHM